MIENIARIKREAEALATGQYLRKGFVDLELRRIIALATVFIEQIKKYSPNQPRVPAGNPDGGQWTSGDSGNNQAFDMNEALDYLKDNADPLPPGRGRCATYVTEALSAGGLNIGKVHYAKDYGKALDKHGFTRVTPNPPPNYKPNRGDIVVIQPVSGPKQHGHVAISDGHTWWSDFRQPRPEVWAGPKYRAEQPAYQIYRR